MALAMVRSTAASTLLRGSRGDSAAALVRRGAGAALRPAADWSQVLVSARAPEDVTRAACSWLGGTAPSSSSSSSTFAAATAEERPQIAALSNADAIEAAQAIAAACHALGGLKTFAPADVCAMAAALAAQSVAHRPLLADAVAAISVLGAAQRCPPAALRALLEALAVTSTPVPAKSLDSWLTAIARSEGGLSGGESTSEAASLLRSLLLLRVEGGAEGEAQVKHAAGFAGRLLSACVLSPGPAAAALADVAWLARGDPRAPPAWWRPPAAHHAALLQSVELRSSVEVAAPPQECSALTVEAAARQALQRLRCEFHSNAAVAIGASNTVAEGAVGCGAAALRVPLYLPELRLALECVGSLGELRIMEGDHDLCQQREASQPILAPLLEVRHARLVGAGVRVELLRETEWPLPRVGEDTKALHGREELLLRRKLAVALQQRVPRRRRRTPWPGQRSISDATNRGVARV
eukprot:TRINITY_DN54211_c0_g1_i1.p1 TRINITY_DN54211_c0_g1~~TRINITY_DN54211_c0_g1_i1.p1  ORF type:complete len:487 (-),score=85.95 TRINITY_DN54211_c0_g1_i1:59-1462(-)